MHIPKLVPTLVAAVLSLVPFGRAYAQDLDVVKLCNELRDPLSLQVAKPQGLNAFQSLVFSFTLYYRIETLYYLRQNQLAQEAEARLNFLLLGLPNESQKAKDALAQIRQALQAEAKLAENKAKQAAVKSANNFKDLCGDVQPPIDVTLQPLPGLLPLISVVTAPPAPPAPRGCDALPGTWAWSWGHGNETKGNSVTTITSDHKMSQPDNHGTWRCSGSSVTFSWTQSTDTLSMVDKDTLQGGSNLGDWVKAKRQ